MTILDALKTTTERIKTWAESTFLAKDDFGVYVQDTEPTDAKNGDIWIDTNSDPSSITCTDPTVPAWAREATKPSYTANEVGADPSGTAESKVSSHNTSTSAHNDIRKILQSLSDSVQNFTYTETDPTVPAWAKASTKPSYTKSEVGLGNVANVLQYSASNPPPYPVSSINGKTGAVTVSEPPSVTTADNGKVLMVVNGEWKAVDLVLYLDGDGVMSIRGGA